MFTVPSLRQSWLRELVLLLVLVLVFVLVPESPPEWWP
jgi:hypothetical protein